MSSTNSIFYRAVTELIQSDETEKALEALETFLDENTDDEIALSLLGSALMRSGDTERALSTFKHIVALYPDVASAHSNLGFVAMKAGDRDQAIESYENAIRISSDSYQAWTHLGKLYFDAGDFEAALKAVENAKELDPLEQESRLLLSTMQAKNFARTEEIARSMLAKQPGHPRAVAFLARLARNVDAQEERIEILKHGLSYQPANVELRRALVVAYQHVGKFELALQEAKLLVKIRPDHSTYWTLSRACGQAGDHAGALSSAEKSASYLRNNRNELGKVDLLRGHTLKILGRREESEAAYHDCIRNTWENGAGWWGLADLKTYQFSAEDKQTMETFAGNETLARGQRCQAAFALAKAIENDGDHEKAFHWYKKANDLRPDITFSPDQNRKLCNTIIAEFDADMLGRQADPQPSGPTPIFVVGMPRAGSTLIEQILASHSQIEGTMELMTLPYLERTVKITGKQKFSKNYPRSLRDFSQDELSAFGQAYLDDTAIFRTSKPYFIDKLPPNFQRIGLIHKILPQAVIIDARRHPLDCGFSAYKQHFGGGHEYSYSLENIGHYFNDYLRLMDHWDSVLPGKVRLVQYEHMVQDTETLVREMLAHVGVDFEEACLRFFENKRAVKTASSEQVRQPIYSNSIGRWQTVSDQLKPLIDSLGEETMARFQNSMTSSEA
jgi:tetratricopeptide (TPR) repeat protein